MDRMQQMILAKALMDGDWRSNHGGNRRVMTVDELDALADFGWPWPDLKGLVAAAAHAVRSRWRSGAIARTQDASVVSAEARRAA